MNPTETAEEQLDTLLRKTNNRDTALLRPETVRFLKKNLFESINWLINLPFFQKHARWAIETLQPGAETPERALVVQIGKDLVQYAKAVLEFESKQKIVRELAKQHQPVEYTCHAAKVSQTGEWKFLSEQRENLNPISNLVEQVRGISNGKIPEFVGLEDYFGLFAFFTEFEDGTIYLAEREQVVANPEIPPVGNLIVDCLFLRIKEFTSLVQDLHKRIKNAVNQLNSKYESLMEKMDEAWSVLDHHTQELKRLTTEH